MSTFHIFDRLPAEIRLKIWQSALSEKVLYAADVHPTDQRMWLVPVGPSPLSIGQSCFEARDLVKKTYTRVPFKVDPRDGGGVGRWVGVWFSSSTLVFLGSAGHSHSVLGRFRKPEPALRFLAVEEPRGPRGSTSGVALVDMADFQPTITNVVMHYSAWRICPCPTDFSAGGGAARLEEALCWYHDACVSDGEGKDWSSGFDGTLTRSAIEEEWTSRGRTIPRIHLLTESDGWPFERPENALPPFDNFTLVLEPCWHADAWPASQWQSVFPPKD